jgi:subtilisin family serine protease
LYKLYHEFRIFISLAIAKVNKKEGNMDRDERYSITSEDYVDLIIDYKYNPRFLEEFQDTIIHKINDTFAILHIPLTSNPERIVREYGYMILPKVYGLTSEISLEASRVGTLRNLPAFNLTGRGVLIGFIDTGIDYLHPAFRNAEGLTKIAYIWDQTIDSEDAYPFDTYYGTEYSAEQINQALLSENPLDIVPSTDDIGHGTMMAGVAVGSDNLEVNFEGVALDSELVIVKLKQAKQNLRDFFLIPENVIAYQDSDIMWGVQYCEQVARRLERPIVICLGIGTSQTSHSGRSNLSKMLTRIGGYAGVGIVIGAGNEGNLGRHFYNTIKPEVGTLAELYVGRNDKNFSMEIWGDAPNLYYIDILSPAGEYIQGNALVVRESREITFIFEQTVISMDIQIANTAAGNQLILLRFRNATTGIWRFTIYSKGDVSPGAHIWLPMGDFISTDTYFISPDIYTTVLSPGTAYTPITVTAYNPFNESLYANASRGYTNNNIIKPELAAPGVNYIAPTLNGGFTTHDGTSVAAAHTAGIVALFFEWAIVRKNDVRADTTAVKNYLIRGAKRKENLIYPNRDWGYGIIDIYNVFNILRGRF